MLRSLLTLLVVLLCLDAKAQTTHPARKYPRATGVEPAKRATMQEYIDRYGGGETGDDLGCTIGGQTFRNFKLHVKTSVVLDQGQPHPSPPKTADEIILTPINYEMHGRRWVGFHFTTGENGWEILGGDKLPKDYTHIKGHDIKNNGFMSNYDVRFEVHGTSPWQQAKVAYAGLATDRFVDGEWSEAKNTGPGSRGNLGFNPRRIGKQGGYGILQTDPKANATFARIASISRGFNEPAKAPLQKMNVVHFVPGKQPTSFELREGYWPDYGPGHETHLGMYGIWFRINCWNQKLTRWRADYIEYAFSNDTITKDGATPEIEKKILEAFKNVPEPKPVTRPATKPTAHE